MKLLFDACRSCVLLFVLGAASAVAAEPGLPMSIEAARAELHASAPPTSGWVDVTLPDVWSKRWPDYDGVVWYRLSWDQPTPLDNVAFYLEYLTFAGEIWVNGALVARDASLVEPLTRMWNVPRYWRLPPPLIKSGQNTILVRVSGLAQYGPGLGPVLVGDASALEARFKAEQWLRNTINLIGLAISLTVGLFFLAVWLMRRREVAFGWYAAGRFAWLPVAWNTVATSPWPFTTTDAYQNLTEIAVPVSIGCWAMFVLRFCDRRWPRREKGMWAILLLSALWIILAPHEGKLAARNLANALSVLVVVIVDIAFLWFAWRGGRPDQKFLSLCSAAVIGAGVHDVLGVAGIIDETANWVPLTSMVGVIGASMVLAWNFVSNLRRIEGFNVELQQNVDQARGELADTLLRQHKLELAHARLGERVSLAHDLHDGLGGMLIGNITALEHGPESVSSRKMLDALRELRDDLRLIIDTASAQHYGENSLGELLAPLRHRMSRMFEAYDIHLRWHTDRLDDVYLTNTQSLDLMRIVQEALTNVLKHAQAKRVEVELRNSNEAMILEIRDDGRGLSETDPAQGTGMHSMQARARRLSATLSIASKDGGTLVRLHRPWPPTNLHLTNPA
ncbi:MAG TPA: 7TM diverse intracellular signaling domain-containing protein [Dokdonella sp.]|uniref:sensor histidine kinase n=1 Tax=Dokdonella sp. TaxID=2291710 RepID=UPI002D7F9719|nr:7TM diverse intracellular signaling domain-containing protein [Dokdonella sp.]HET9033860.1 7TM diverse intracellular signaling domain-containing protein [Dokdonella sp.]